MQTTCHCDNFIVRDVRAPNVYMDPNKESCRNMLGHPLWVTLEAWLRHRVGAPHNQPSPPQHTHTHTHNMFGGFLWGCYEWRGFYK